MRYLLALLFALLAIPSMAQSGSVSLPSYVDSDALAIYREVLPPKVQGKSWLLLSTTTAGEMCDNLGHDVPTSGDYAEAIADFKRVSAHPWRLESLFATIGPTQFVTKSELNSLFHGSTVSGWKKFYRRYPNTSGYIALSAIGYSKARNLAAVYLEAVCGSLCGAGKLRFMQLGPQGWKEVTPPFGVCDWIS
jgi:hypothetical protein